MRTRARLLGHSLHPMLIVLPLGLLTASVIFDVVRFATGDPMWAEIAFWNIAVGIVSGLVAAIPGLVDYFTLPRGTRARQVGTVHALANVSALLLFALSWTVRLARDVPGGGVGAFVLSLAGLTLLYVGGWLGGELVERLGVGVWEDAHPDAPSSLAEEEEPGVRPTEPRPA